MVTKLCPKCTQQVPVACKTCTHGDCGHIFFTSRRPISIHKLGENRDEKGEIKRRRTERINRERPDYFNSLQVNNHLKTIRKGRHRGSNSTSSSTNDNDGEGSNSEECALSGGKRKRGRPKGSVNKKKDKDKEKLMEISKPEKEEDLFSNLSAEKEIQYSIILAEINRKLCAQQFKI